MDLTQLAVPFPPTDIEWRLQSAGKNANGIWAKCLAYITNRAIMERLDKVCGPGNWKNEYRDWTTGTAGVLCGISIRINDGNREPEWVTKWDGAEQTDVEAMKGGLSAAMKRAAVQWGIGRYLYDLPEGWAKINERGEHFGKLKQDDGGDKFRWDNPDLPTWALPGGENGNAKPAAYREPAPKPHAFRGPGDAPQAPTAASAAPAGDSRPVVNPNTAHPPTEKQINFYVSLASESVFTVEEKKRALEWLETKATRQTVKDQIDWLKRQVEQRKLAKPVLAGSAADEAGESLEMPEYMR